MSLSAQTHFVSVEEYLRREEDAAQKHEYRDGEILAMAGASPEHVLIAMNFLGELRNAFKGKPCHVYGSDLKVAISKRSQITYPDGSIVCGPLQFHPAAALVRTVVTNPRVLIEVLSPSTEQYDRTAKFDLYRDIDSFEEYVLVAQQAPRVETNRRFPDGSWHFEAFAGIEAFARIGCVDATVPLREIYAGVSFSPPTREAASI